MEEVNYELYESLKKEVVELDTAIAKQEEDLNVKLFNYLDTISIWKEADIAPIHCSIYLDRRNWNDGEYTPMVSTTVRFYKSVEERRNKDEEEIDNYDFELKIYPSEIKVSMCSMSGFTRQNKVKLAIVLTVAKLFEKELDFCNFVFSNINVNDLEHRKDSNHKIWEIEAAIKRNEEEARRNEAIAKLTSAKYLFEHNVKKKYDYDLHKYVGEDHHFYNKFVIEKITDKSIIGYYEQYRWDRKRLDRSSYLYSIENGAVVAVTDEPHDYYSAYPEGGPIQ